MKTKTIKDAPSLESVLLNPFYKGHINNAKHLQAQADSFFSSARLARGKLAYVISRKLLKFVPKGSGRMLLELDGNSFVSKITDPSYSIYLFGEKKSIRITLLCELVNSALNRSNFMSYGNIFWSNGCVIITDYGINNYLETTDPKLFLQNAITIINEAWTKDNNKLGSLSFDELVDDKEKGQKFRILFKPGGKE